jgi:heterodisulfide reductase subunit A2
VGILKERTNKKDVLIVGAGLAGMSAAMLLADRGFDVALVEKLSAVGGYFPLLEKQFPTNSCGVCFLSPNPASYCPFVECSLRKNISIIEDAEVTGVGGSDNDFSITLNRFNFIDNSRCIDCGKCAEVCPVDTPHEFGGGMEARKAVYKQFPKMAFRGYRIDDNACTRCGDCVEVCPTGAIDLKRGPESVKIAARKVILSPGFTHNVKKMNAGYGLGQYENVVTSVQFERLVSASGPTSGTVLRPGDGKPAESIAFIQCAGSRAVKKRGNPYCSSVCCMIAVKQALLSKEQNPDVRIKIFYMDTRTSGKGYEEYLNRAKKTEGIEFIRFHITSLKEGTDAKNVRIGYSREGRYIEEEFDLAVLSVGFYQEESTHRLLETFGIEMNDYGFTATEEFQPNRTNVPGVFAAGSVTEPMDIIEATASGASAAALVMEEFFGAQEPDPSQGTAGPSGAAAGPSRGAAGQTAAPRIGVFLCTCSGTIDPEVLEHCKNFPEVNWTGTADLLCLERGTGAVKKAIAENSLQRMVIAGCSVRELQVLFSGFFEETGYSELDFEFVNIRDALMFDSAETAKQLLASAIRKVKLNAVPEALHPPAAPRPGDDNAPERGRRTGKTNSAEPGSAAASADVLVIGGGAAGLTAALRCANQGFKTAVVEKKQELGGRLNDAFYTLKGSKVREQLQALVRKAEKHGNIEIYRSAEIASVEGTTGLRITAIVQNDKEGGGGRSTETALTHSTVIVATGGNEAVPSSYGYGESPNIMTQSELERKIGEGDLTSGKYKRAVMIQCVESREPGKREYCSRVCCNHALKNILKLKELNEGLEITVLHRDIRSYGFNEDYYQRARNAGVLFVEYDLDTKPQVEYRGKQITVTFTDPVLDVEIAQGTDLLVLSAGIEPAETNRLAELYDVPADVYGFFEEVNKKAGTVKSIHKDIFFCGLCQGPKHIEESIVQANAAAAHASAALGKRNAPVREKRAFVLERFCSGCGICVEVCPYNARVMNPETNIAEVIGHICEGCGGCVSACPNGAAEMYGCEKGQVLEYVDMVCEYTK